MSGTRYLIQLSLILDKKGSFCKKKKKKVTCTGAVNLPQVSSNNHKTELELMLTFF